jgi:thymidylate synthase ThyX
MNRLIHFFDSGYIMSFKAEVIADSKNEHGHRITTFVVTFPRFILAEFNTHRMFSRNSASSRAIPFKKMMKMVLDNPFVPIKFMKDHSGMQGNQYFEDPEDIEWLTKDWIKSSQIAVREAKRKHNYKEGLSKQICNRILEPFMWHTAIVTSTEWENFFALRSHGSAEIHIEKISDMMLSAYNTSVPVQLKAGEWHIPFGDKFEDGRLMEFVPEDIDPKPYFNDLKVKIATARCARVSYMNFEGKDDYGNDIKLHDSLSASGHWSPFEHCAWAMSGNNLNYYQHTDVQENPFGWCGNYQGFIQYRKTFSGENRNDPRVVKK